MPEFNIDDFKKTWQDHSVQPKYDSIEIEKMLHKSSHNYVKYILGISLAEFLIILGLNLYYLFVGSDSATILNMFTRLGIAPTAALQGQVDTIYLALKIVSFALTAYFLFRFYRSYSSIKVISNLKKLILQIINFKKTVNLFILANIVLMVLFMVALGSFVFYIVSSGQVQPDHPTLIGFYIGFALTTLFSVILIWVYYRIVYGIILKRLSKNLQELKKIENLQN